MRRQGQRANLLRFKRIEASWNIMVSMVERLSWERCALRKETGDAAIPTPLAHYCAFSSPPTGAAAVAAPSTLATTAVRAIVGLAGFAAGEEARGTAGEEVEGPEGVAIRRSSASRASCLCNQGRVDQPDIASRRRKTASAKRKRTSSAPPQPVVRPAPACTLLPLPRRPTRYPSPTAGGA